MAPDGRLLRVVERWRSANDAVEAFPDALCATAEGQNAFEALCDTERDAMKRVLATPASTLAGIRAKATALRVVLYRYHEPSIAEGCAGDEIHLAVSLCDDLIKVTA